MATKVKKSKKGKGNNKEVKRLRAEAEARVAAALAAEEQAQAAKAKKEAGRATYRQLQRRVELGGALLPEERKFLERVERAKVKVMREHRELKDLEDRVVLKRKTRNNTIRVLCDLGVSEREVGELTGMTGPRINQIYFGTNGSRS